jgi:predicted enzyme related to lactoylglutathione lyase
LILVTGLGGIFIKANDPRYLARWYEDNLGIGFGTTVYFSFKWREQTGEHDISHTVFSFFDEETTYFYPGTNDVMINFRVNNLDNLRIQLKAAGAHVIEKIESYEYGRFGWALDPAGNKIELWEPNDDGFEDRNKPMNLRGVSGFGGIYIRTPKVKELTEWYSKNLGLFFSSNVHTFDWNNLEMNNTGSSTLSFYPEDTKYFDPSQKTFMISFRVKNLERMLYELKDTEATIVGEIQKFTHGRFAWFIDPEGNKVELWEPK